MWFLLMIICGLYNIVIFFLSIYIDDMHLTEILENYKPLTLFGPIALILCEETHLN